jgi:hypothetical protein
MTLAVLRQPKERRCSRRLSRITLDTGGAATQPPLRNRLRSLCFLLLVNPRAVLKLIRHDSRHSRYNHFRIARSLGQLS